MKFTPVIIVFLIVSSVFSQNTEDVERLSKLKYMEFAERINCDSTDGTSYETRVCLNLEFQRVDSILNTRLVEYLNSIEVDSTKTRFIDYHNEWVEYRRFQSKHISKGLRGHSLGIYYLDCMVRLTNGKIEELEYLMKYE